MTRSGLDIRMTILHEENALPVVFMGGIWGWSMVCSTG